MLRRVILAAALSLASASPAFAAWHEARTKHFIIYSEQQPDRLKAYAEKLERFDAAVRRVRGYADPALTDGARLTIFELPSVAAVQRLLPRNSQAAGFYIPKASGAVAFVSREGGGAAARFNPDHLIQHEYTHHLMLTDPKSPLAAWLVEGTAEFFATAEVQKDGSVEVGHPPMGRGPLILRDLGFSAGDLLAGTRPRNNLDRSSIYAKGWLLTHYLSFSESRRGQLDRYVAGLARGLPTRQAAESAFGDLGRLDREIDAYATKRFAAVQVPAGPAPVVQLRPLGEAEAAIMPVRIRVDRGLPRRDVAAVADTARQIAARYPTDPEVQAVLAEVELAGGRYRPAIAAADRALASNPRHIGAMIIKGRALLDEARGQGKAADWREVRRWLVQANRADTENAEPLYLFYQTFGAAGEKPTAAAINGLYYAHVLMPHDVGLRFTAVRQMLIDGEVAKALISFAPIVANPHLDLDKRPLLVEAMTRMRAGDGPGALAAIEADYRSGRATSET